MGRVYATEEVIEGCISYPPRHREAGRYALSALFSNTSQSNHFLDNGEPLFDSAMVYGSTIDGPGPSVRSDLDLLVIHHPGAEAGNRAYAVLDELARTIRSSFKVPLEQQLYAKGEVNDSDPLYAQHIAEMAKTKKAWRVNNPATEFTGHLKKAEDEASVLLCAAAYTFIKAESFELPLANYAGFADNKALQRALELASAIGRKVLPAVKEPDELVPHISDKAGMRAAVETKISSYFEGQQRITLLDHQRALAALDKEYTNVLLNTLQRLDSIARIPLLNDAQREQARRGSISIYDTWLEDHYLEACQRAEQLSRSWGIVLEDRLQQVAPGRCHELDTLLNSAFYGIDDYS